MANARCRRHRRHRTREVRWRQACLTWARARGGHPHLDRAVRAWARHRDRHGPELAATVTLRAVLALVPAAGTLIALVTLALPDPAAQQRLTRALLDAFLPGLAGPVLPSGPLQVGSAGAAVAATWVLLALGVGLIGAARRAIAAMFDTPDPARHPLAERAANLLTLAQVAAVVAAAAGVCLSGRVLIHALLDAHLPGQVPLAMTVGTQLVGAFGVAAAATVVTRRALPATQPRWRAAARTGAAVSTSTTVLKGVFLLYAHAAGTHASVYGAFAAAAGVLVWLSLTTRAALLAAAWTALAPTRAHRGDRQAGPD